VINIKSFYDNYLNFPKTDCGYCGCTSCVALLRRHYAGEASLSDCIYFEARGYCKEDFVSPKHFTNTKTEPSVSYVSPCPSDAERVTVEVNLASDLHSKYGYFDMISAEKLFGQSLPEMKIAPSLGLARLESDGEAVMGFAEGRILIRRALNENDAFWQLSRFIRWLWGAVN
jgi:ArsR family metal-binding transcriptional regulator